MKGRAYRRYMQEKVFKKRLTHLNYLRYHWFRYRDVNGNKHQFPLISDLLADPAFMRFKNISTDRYNTRRKIKFSPNRSKEWYRDNKKLETREFRNKEFLKILKENGLK